VVVSSATRKPWAALLGALLLAALTWYAGSDWVRGRFGAPAADGTGDVTSDRTGVVAGAHPDGTAMESDRTSSLNAAAWDAGALEDASTGPPAYIGVPLKQVEPVYPQAAKDAGIEGLVIVTYTLDAEGRASDLHVARSVPMLDEAVLSALRKWEYPPVPPGVTPPNYRYNVEFVLDDWRR
jgi:TonB family protein